MNFIASLFESKGEFMKSFLICLSLFVFALPAHAAAPRASTPPPAAAIDDPARQNLIGEVISIDRAGGRITLRTDAKEEVIVAFGAQTAFRRVAPGETSLRDAEIITIADLQIGDRVLVPGGAAGAPAPVKQIVVMARAAIEQNRADEREKRRARTTVGRIASIDAARREIVVQARGRGNPETVTVDFSKNPKILRYAADSLRPADAVAGAFADLRAGDQIRVVGERSGDGARIAAEETVSGAVARTVGTIVEIDRARNLLIVKNGLTDRTIAVALGKNTKLRRLTPEASAALRRRFERRNARRGGENNADDPATAPRGRERRRDRGDERSGAQNRRPPLADLPEITAAELKKGDAVLIVATGAVDAASLTAVTITAGDGDLERFLQRTEGGRDGNLSPGLPGNVSGGNAVGSDDGDEPER